MTKKLQKNGAEVQPDCSTMDEILANAQDLLQHAVGCLETMVHNNSPLMQDVVTADAKIEAVRVWLKWQNKKLTDDGQR